MSRARSIIVKVLVVLALAVAPARAAPGETRAQPWEGRAFTASAADMLQAARDVSAEPGTPAIVLLLDMSVSYDAQGRAVRRYRRVSKILDQRGVEIEGSIESGWAPWYQHRPEIRARVLTRDGTFHPLDPATASESSPPQSPHMYSDHRVLRAPLPAVAPGAIVEIETIKKDHTPFFGRGATHRFYFGDSVPVRKSQLIVEGPRSLGLHHVKKDLPGLQVKSAGKGHNVRWIFSHGPVEPFKPAEPGLPGDVAPYPYLAVAPKNTWADLAARYQTIVDERIAQGDVKAIPMPPARSKDTAGVVRDTLAFLHDNVRYTGLEFGASSIVPWTPAETWTRKYGDCKDKATLLVALLRRQGVRAHVALLRAGRDEDVNPSLPGMGGFNHAIVYVPGKRPIWIDPTDEYARAGELPMADQGRLALIANARTRKLVRIPESTPEHNRVIETREIILSDLGGARVVETTRPTGTFERSFRSGVRDAKPDKLREQYASYMKSTYGSEKLHDYKLSNPRDTSIPFSLLLDARDSREYMTGLERIEVSLPAGALFKGLPDALEPAPDARADKPRKHDFLLEPRHLYELRYRVHVPAGFQVATLPRDETTAVGPAVFSRSFARRGEQIEATLRFDTGPAQRLAPAQFTAMRDALRKVYESDSPTIVVEHTGMAHLAAGRRPGSSIPRM